MSNVCAKRYAVPRYDALPPRGGRPPRPRRCVRGSIQVGIQTQAKGDSHSDGALASGWRLFGRRRCARRGLRGRRHRLTGTVLPCESSCAGKEKFLKKPAYGRRTGVPDLLLRGRESLPTPCVSVFCADCFTASLPPETPSSGKCPICRRWSHCTTQSQSAIASPSPPISTIFGQTYLQGGKVGVASYHFVSPNDCYISYEHCPATWKRDRSPRQSARSLLRALRY